MGCLRRLGCLVILLLVIPLLWITRDRWLHRLTGARPSATSSAVVWEPLTDAGAARARTAVASLGQRSGPVFTNVRAGDLASYVFVALQRQLPPSAQDTRAAVIGERLYVKSLVNLRDFGDAKTLGPLGSFLPERDTVLFGGAKTLGPLGSFLPERDTVLFGGDFAVIEPGLAEYRVQELKVGRLSVPQAMIPKLLQRMRTGGQRQKLSPNGLALAIPKSVGDVRIARGRVTLYKTTAP